MVAKSLTFSLLRVGSTIHASNVETKLRRLARTIESKFDPNQPREPAGNPDGGQWIDTGIGDSVEPAVSGRLRRISTDLEEECWSQYQRDLFQCRMVGAPACYEQAMLRYDRTKNDRSRPVLGSYHKSGKLVLDEPGNGYGFPVVTTMRDLLEGDDAKYF